jgi:hypothetical protein
MRFKTTGQKLSISSPHNRHEPSPFSLSLDRRNQRPDCQLDVIRQRWPSSYDDFSVRIIPGGGGGK